MEATLGFVHDHAKEFRDAKATSKAGAISAPAKEYMEGDLRGPLADAYYVRASIDEVLNLHGIPTGAKTADGWTHNLDHDLRGHAAAAIHPLSSRRLVDGAQATGPVSIAQPQATEPDPAEATSAPSALAAGFAIALACVAFVAHRHR